VKIDMLLLNMHELAALTMFEQKKYASLGGRTTRLEGYAVFAIL
jgi:hypothetical protein